MALCRLDKALNVAGQRHKQHGSNRKPGIKYARVAWLFGYSDISQTAKGAWLFVKYPNKRPCIDPYTDVETSRAVYGSMYA